MMSWRGKTIVDISRAFLDTNGAHQETDGGCGSARRAGKSFVRNEVGDVREKWLDT